MIKLGLMFFYIMSSLSYTLIKALVVRLTLSVGWENGPERGLNIVAFNP